MRKLLLVMAAMACTAGAAIAGPNAGGTLNVHDPNLVYTTDIDSYCGLGGVPASCEDIDTNIENDQTARVWKVYATFAENSSPRLKGMTWGVSYDPSEISLVAWGPCIGDPNNGAAEFPGAGWPGPNTGTSIVWQFTQTDHIVEAYWFAGYSYYGAGRFQLQPHSDPVLGGMFGDDSIPALLDEIAGFGCLGFGTDCETACPNGGDPTGACCIGEECTITTEAECQGQWQGPDMPCDPNPCFVEDTGACCVGEECTITTEAECQGTFQGVGTTCDPNPCFVEPTGACCVDTECSITTEAECQGQWQGQNTTCDPNPCDVNPTEETTWGQIKANYR